MSSAIDLHNTAEIFPYSPTPDAVPLNVNNPIFPSYRAAVPFYFHLGAT